MSKKTKNELAEALAIGNECRDVAAYGRYLDELRSAEEAVTTAFAAYEHLAADNCRMAEIARQTVDICRKHAESNNALLDAGFSLLAVRGQLGSDQMMEHFIAQNLLPFDQSYATKLITVALRQIESDGGNPEHTSAN